MERGMKRSLCSIGVLFAVALSFMTCSNPIDILKSVTNEVKRSNAKFLVVKGLQSPIGTASVNPGTPITIEFDRPVNASTVSSSTITVTPSNGTSIKYSLTIDYSNANKTVTLTPKPFLEDTTQYDVTVTTGVLGDDASELEAPMSWSFKTGVYPAGDITFTDGTHTPDGLGYNKINYIGAVSPLQLWINYKAVVDKYRMSDIADSVWQFSRCKSWLGGSQLWLRGCVYSACHQRSPQATGQRQSIFSS